MAAERPELGGEGAGVGLLDELREWRYRDRPVWIPASANRYGLEILDVQRATQEVTAWTSDKTIAESFVETRSLSGQHHRDADRCAWSPLKCDLAYPYETDPPGDGPVFKSPEMEEKWDIYLYDAELFFARSWTDQLVYVAGVDFRASQAVIDSIQRSPSVSEDADLSRKAVDFLLKSHLYDAVVPHPIHREVPESARQIEAHSFNAFGRRAWFASRGDTTSVHIGPGTPQIGQARGS